uniref:Putative secreted protein n=1 Tax=Anopheles darlingi TaxID=43151 RepID=A0A2M4DSN6_ANODA
MSLLGCSLSLFFSCFQRILQNVFSILYCGNFCGHSPRSVCPTYLHRAEDITMVLTAPGMGPILTIVPCNVPMKVL